MISQGEIQADVIIHFDFKAIQISILITRISKISMKCFLCWFIWIQILLEFIQIRYTVQNAIFEAKNMKCFLTWNEDIDVQIKYDDLELHNLWCLKYAVGVLFKIQSSRKNMFAVIRLSSFDPIVSRISLYIIHCTFKDLFRTIEFIDKDIKWITVIRSQFSKVMLSTSNTWSKECLNDI